jgi:Tfp pilus assembly protein PilF
MKDAFELKQLGESYLEKGDYETAEMLIRRAISIEEHTAPNTVALAEDLFNFGLLCCAMGKVDEAQQNLMRAWKIERAILGPLHPETLETFRTLTEIYQHEENTVTTDFFYSAPKQSAAGALVLH